MNRKGQVTRAQTKFLRGFAANPYGPPAGEWPSPVVLRRWLKRPGFRGAMNSILRALRYQADFHLTAAAASAAHLLHGTIRSGEVDSVRKQVEALIQLLRMSHIRHRFAEPLPAPEPPPNVILDLLRDAHPSITVEEALQALDVLSQDDRPFGEPGDGYRAWKKTGHPFREDWKRVPGAPGGPTEPEPRFDPTTLPILTLQEPPPRHARQDDEEDEDDPRGPR